MSKGDLKRMRKMIRDEIEAELKSLLGAERVIWLPGDPLDNETDGHVDGVGEVVQAHCLGLSDQDGRGRFYMPSFEAGTSGSSLYDSGLSRLGFAKAEIAVDAFALRADALVETYGFPAPNHIKIDVDSIEPQILKGAEGLLRSGRVKSVLIEIAPDDTEIPALLAEAGFSEARRGVQRENTDVNVIFTRGA